MRAVNFKAKRPLGAVRDNGGGSMVNWKTHASLPQPNVHAVPAQGRSAAAEIAEKYDLSGDVFAISTGLMRSRSRGYLRLLGAEPGAPIEIQPNFLADPGDLDDLVDAVNVIMDMAATKAYADWFSGYAAPEKPMKSRGKSRFHSHRVLKFFPCLRHSEDGQ